MEIGAVVRKLEFDVPPLFGNLAFTKESVIVCKSNGEKVVEVKLSNIENVIQLQQPKLETVIFTLTEPIIIRCDKEEETKIQFIRFKVKKVAIPFGNPVEVDMKMLGIQKSHPMHVRNIYGINEKMVGRKPAVINRLIRELDKNRSGGTVDNTRFVNGFGNAMKSILIIENEEEGTTERHEIGLYVTHYFFIFISNNLQKLLRTVEIDTIHFECFEEEGSSQTKLRMTNTVGKTKYIILPIILEPTTKQKKGKKNVRFYHPQYSAHPPSGKEGLRMVYNRLKSFLFFAPGIKITDDCSMLLNIRKKRRMKKVIVRTKAKVPVKSVSATQNINIVEEKKKKKKGDEEEGEEEEEEEEEEDDFGFTSVSYEFITQPANETEGEEEGEVDREGQLSLHSEHFDREKWRLERERKKKEESEKKFEGWSFGWRKD